MKKKLVPLTALALVAMVGAGGIGLASCSGGDSEVVTSSSSEFAVSITNREALQADWFVNDANRSVELSVTPNVNILDALAEKTLTIVSSNADVVSVNGRVLTAVGKGSATVTVTYQADIAALQIGRAHV